MVITIQDNDYAFIYVGVEEENTETNKAIPVLPIIGIEEGAIEKSINSLLSLKSFLYPKIEFEIVRNEYNSKKYLLVIVPKQKGGPFNVTDKAETDKKINLKAGKYIRIDFESGLAKVHNEVFLLYKFANFHFSTMINNDATIKDLNINYMLEYLSKTSDREINFEMSKKEICHMLKLVDDENVDNTHVKNLAILMFADKLESFIKEAYIEMIADINGDKKKMDRKLFTDPIWKQYTDCVNYIKNNFLNTIVVREENTELSRDVANYPFTAIEELVANAIVHKNYENQKAIVIYVLEDQINIINYNNPLPPVSTDDLNSKTLFIEKDYINPEIRNMFKSLNIIEAFGTGIGEAKKAMAKNKSPQIYYKKFDDNSNVTSVVIPINLEYLKIKTGNVEQKIIVENNDKKSRAIKAVQGSMYKKDSKKNLLKIIDNFFDSSFSNSDIAKLLPCSETTATGYIKKLNELKLIVPITGMSKGKYIFIR